MIYQSDVSNAFWKEIINYFMRAIVLNIRCNRYILYNFIGMVALFIDFRDN